MTQRRIGRRGVLLGIGGAGVAVIGAGAGLLEENDLPMSAAIRRRLGWTGPAGHVPDVSPGPVSTSTTAGIDWALCLPPGPVVAGLPLVVALGGKDQGIGYLLTNLGLPQFLAAGHHQFALLAVAGQDSYYHQRSDGSDVGRLVLEQLVPLAARSHGLDSARLAFLGWSMGGYGALLLAAERLRQGRPVAAAAVSSAAVWPSYAASAPGAFDDASDFAANALSQRADLLRLLPVRVYCGEQDPFYESDRALVRRIDAHGYYAAGAHDAAFWTRVLPSQLSWLEAGLGNS